MILRCLLVFNALAGAATADWPQFRGPTGQGVVPAGDAPLVWSETENILWKTPLPGKGWSSPVVLGDKVWMTTAVVQAASQEEAKEKGQGGVPKNQFELAARLDLLAICVDRSTGEVVKEVELFSTEEADAIHSLNSYASPTPVIEPGRLYCHFGTYGNACVDTQTGDVLWRRVLPLEHYVGPGSSPIVYGELLVLTYDGADVQYVTALDKHTGETAWKTDRPPIRQTNPDRRKSYSTPIVVTVGGADQIVIPGANWLVAYEPATGIELWRVDHNRGFSLVPRPVAGNGLVYYATGYGDEAVQAVRLGGSGDVTDSHIEWRSKRLAPTQASPLLAAGRLFTVTDNGVGRCLDASTGEQLWRERLGGTYSASPLLSGDRVYYFSREGRTTVIDNSGEEPVVERTNEIEGRIMASPAVVDGVMYLRAEGVLYAIAESTSI